MSKALVNNGGYVIVLTLNCIFTKQGREKRHETPTVFEYYHHTEHAYHL